MKILVFLNIWHINSCKQLLDLEMSLKSRLETAYRCNSVRERADLTSKALSENASKEIHSHFVELVDQLFSNKNWGLFDTTKVSNIEKKIWVFDNFKLYFKKNKMDFESLSRLLGPTGPLLENINRLNSDPFLRYALPKKVKIIY